MLKTAAPQEQDAIDAAMERGLAVMPQIIKGELERAMMQLASEFVSAIRERCCCARAPAALRAAARSAGRALNSTSGSSH